MRKALLLVGLLAVVALVLGVTLPTSDQQVATPGPKGEQGLTGPQGPRGLQGPAGPRGLQGPAGVAKLGSVTGPELWSPFWNVNGARTWFYDVKMNASGASTTICSFKMPNATTTPLLVTGQITTASSTALQFEWGKSTLMDATTTSLGMLNLASDVKATFVASTSPGAFAAADLGDPTYVVAPNNYVNLKFGASATGSGLAGRCKGVFLEN